MTYEDLIPHSTEIQIGANWQTFGASIGMARVLRSGKPVKTDRI